jgi:hypothetical protein
MKRASLVLLGALSFGALSLSACNKSSDNAEKKAETKAAEPSEEKKAARPKPPPVDEGIDVPTEEDFEESVATQLTDDSNLQKELDQLEKEIGK